MRRLGLLALLAIAALGAGAGWLKEETDRRGIAVHWTTAWQMYKAADAVIHDRDPLAISN